jgi:F1F0 ATPase subunit 2
MLVRLEVDGQRMNAGSLALYLAAGLAVGALYFASLWWNAEVFGRGGRTGTLIAAVVARFVLLSFVLTAASLQGAWPLLATAAGVLLARSAVLRWARVTTP